MSDKHAKIILTERDRAILSFVRDHGAVWFDVLHRRFFAGGQAEMARSTLRRLCGTAPTYRLLRPFSQRTGMTYYQLTFAATKLLGCSAARSRPLGRGALAQRFAVQWFIFLAGADDRVLVTEKSDLGALAGKAAPRDTLFVSGLDSNLRLGIILVDHGGSVRRLIRKIITKLLAVVASGGFQRFLVHRAFCLAVLTVSHGKKRSIDTALARTLARASQPNLRTLRELVGPGRNIEISVQVVPGLDQWVFTNEVPQ
jgi:hypothetical protein